MTTFVYRDIIKGETILLPKLERQVENTWTGHQSFISLYLREFGDGWRVVFSPPKTGRGRGAVCLTQKWLFITYGRRKEMLITFFHELIHCYLPELTASSILHRKQWARDEKKIDQLAKKWYANGICPLLASKEVRNEMS